MATMQYGDYTWSGQPIPLLDINKEFNKAPDGTIIGSTFSVTLDGTLVEIDLSGLKSVDIAQDALRDAFATQGQLFKVVCGDRTVIETYPRIISMSFPPSNNNWVFTSPYTIQLEWDDDPAGSGENSGLMPPYIRDFSENWSVEFVDENTPFTWVPNGTTDSCPYQLRLTHNISAVGKTVYTTGVVVKAAWQQAQDYVVPRLGFDAEFLNPSGVLNLNSASFVPYNHVRTNSIDEAGGSFEVTESWIVINSGAAGIAGNAIEDFTININTSIDTPITSVNIDGSIQGLESRTYGTNSGDFTVDQHKYSAASGYWNTVSARLYDRAKQAAGSLSSGRQLHLTPMTTVVGHSIKNGRINYSYAYNDRPSNIVPNSISENIQINDTNSTDLFASHVILGRTAGPLLQNLNTVTAPRRNLSIEVVVQPPTGALQSGVVGYLAQRPAADVAVLVDAVEADLTGAYDGVFKTQDSDSWTPLQGRYSRQVEWIYSDC